MSWLRTLLAWFLYIIGDVASRIGYHWDSALIWLIYQRTMIWSMLLDREGRIWHAPDIEITLDK